MQKSVKNDNEEEVSQFLDHGIDCNVLMEEASVKSASEGATVKEANKQNRKEWTPMHYAAENGSGNVILILTNRGAGVDPTDSLERTPLMIAIENNKTELVKTLIGLGARVGLLDIFGRTPLMYACKVGSPEIVDFLIK